MTADLSPAWCHDDHLFWFIHKGSEHQYAAEVEVPAIGTP